jgi:hypothetical protein
MKSKPKETTLEIVLELAKGSVKPATVNIDPAGNVFLLDDVGNSVEPAWMSRSMSYEREKGPKIQSRTRLVGNTISLSGLRELAKFDLLFAIDTNTRAINGRFISVSAFVQWSLHEKSGEFNFSIEQDIVGFYEFENACDNAEGLAAFLLASDIARGESRKKLRVGLVTDSSLGAHDKINERVRPIYGLHPLPDGCSLIYASSDTGREITNVVLRFCDKEAARKLKVRALGIPPDIPYRRLHKKSPVSIVEYMQTGVEVTNPSLPSTYSAKNATLNLYTEGNVLLDSLHF